MGYRIRCTTCGAKIETYRLGIGKVIKCRKCKNTNVIGKDAEEITREEKIESVKTEPDNTLRCKKCNSTELSANQKGFGAGKALVGAALTGGIGLLGGFIGSKKVKITCLQCGYVWYAGKK